MNSTSNEVYVDNGLGNTKKESKFQDNFSRVSNM